MNFQDNEKNSVQSLLALLRSTQDGSTSSTDGAATQAGPAPKSPHRGARTLSRSASGTLAPGSTPGGASVPSTQQLNDLLRTLNGSTPATPARAAPPPISPGSAAKASRNLIEPFGPIKDFTNPSAIRRSSGSRTDITGGNVETAVEDVGEMASGAEGRGEDAAWATMSFAKALPKLGEMMGDERFMLELRKMKADQDALERRLWAKQEKIKAEHERSIQAERDIARIAQRPIPADKRAQWASNLDLNLRDFHLQTCLPSLDSLSKRQKDRLEEMGVPGLGGNGSEEKTVARWRKIMDLLQAGLGD